jgi:lantibiotic modifying enzyme
MTDQRLYLIKELEEVFQVFYYRQIKNDESFNWLILNEVENSLLNFSLIDNTIYDGTLGVALAMMEYDRFRVTNIYKKKISDLITNMFIEKHFHVWVEKIIAHNGIGGLGGHLYAYAKLNQYYKIVDNSVFQVELVKYILARKQVSKNYDVITGLSGLILALLYNYQLSKNLFYIRVARRYVPALKKYVLDKNNQLHGMGHGVLGAIFTLSKYYYYTNDEEMIPVISNSLELHNTQKEIEQASLQDVRWCNGILGSQLSILGAYGNLGKKELPDYIVSNVQRMISNYPFQKLDDLCCGNLGLIELILNFGRVYPKENYYSIARNSLCRIIKTAKDNGGFKFSSRIPRGAFQPGYYKGLSGLAHQIIGVLKPEDHRSILLWE